MILVKKIAHVFALVFLAFQLVSCTEECTLPDEFDSYSIVIDSNPIGDIYGTYDVVTGGQRANWKDTSLRANGEEMIFQISGSWVTFGGSSTSADEIKLLDRCKVCSKRFDDSSPNCICHKNETSEAEKDIGGQETGIDCNDSANQEDPNKCTCTEQHGEATDYGVYHFPLNVQNKNETLRLPDEQRDNCKYDRGMGAYISLWGPRGVSTPLRAYHLYTEDEVCNVVRNSQGKCLDASGKDVTRYMFKTQNAIGLMKDDGAGNNDIDINAAGDIYHNPNERLKVVMYDSYYDDNYGQYNINIYGGVGDDDDPGLLEFLVSLIEDVLLGEVDDFDGKRDGGVIKFMYNSIVKDSGFALTVQVALSLYITLFGLAHLLGIVELSSKKEIMSRVLKICLIILFVDENSWYFYNDIVVAFFKDSMDYVVGMIMSLQDQSLDPTTLKKIEQMTRPTDVSSSTRFAYIDSVIRTMMSEKVTKKIWGLFIGDLFGFIYIPAIYVMIASFIYVMLSAASMYISNIIKLIFVLALGPIFMIFSLFSKTSDMFKNWIAFLGGRSMEIIIIFTVLYFFVTIIDKYFTDLLFFKSCGVNKGVGAIKFIVLIAESTRSFPDWMLALLAIGALIGMTYLVLQKIPDVVAKIVTIGGVQGGSGSGMAGGMMSAISSIAKTAGGGLGSGLGKAGGLGARGLTSALRSAGIIDPSKSSKIPSPRSFYRHLVIDGAIKKATKDADAKGLQGKDRDQAIRRQAVGELQLLMRSRPGKMGLIGADMSSLSGRLDKKLVKEPLKKFLKQEAKNMNTSDKFGAEATQHLKDKAKEWANNNLNEGSDRVEKYLNESKSLNNLINSKGRSNIGSAQAATQFGDDKAKKDKYLQHLMNEQANYAKKKKESKWYSGNKIKRAYHNIRRDEASNPRQAQNAFLRKAWQKDNDKSWHQRRRFANQDLIAADRLAEQKRILNANLLAGKGDSFSRDRLRYLANKGNGMTGGLNDNMSFINACSGKEIFEQTAIIAANEKKAHDEVIREYIRLRAHEMVDMKYTAKEKLEESIRLTQLGVMAGDENEIRAAKIQGLIIDDIASVADHKMQNDGPVLQKFEVEFGADISNALMKESDIGMKACDEALLGIKNGGGATADNTALQNTLQLSKNQLSTRIKINKMNKNIAEYALAQLNKKSDPTTEDNRTKATLEGEISGLDKDVAAGEREMSEIDAGLNHILNTQ